jgi:hypothetical protein
MEGEKLHSENATNYQSVSGNTKVEGKAILSSGEGQGINNNEVNVKSSLTKTWQTWQKRQVIPALLLCFGVFFGVSFFL